jgi:mRNA interferase MazF
VGGLDPTIGHEIKKTRPALIIQNDVTNEHSQTTMVAPITSTVRLAALARASPALCR